MCQLQENETLREGIHESCGFVTNTQLKEIGTFHEFLSEVVKYSSMA